MHIRILIMGADCSHSDTCTYVFLVLEIGLPKFQLKHETKTELS